jgi:hypothetical protein
MTPKIDPEDSASTMVALDTIKIVFIASYHMKLKCLAGDITLAYIQAFTKEKVYTIAGPEFGEALEGCILLIHKALYGLQGSGKAWQCKLADDLYTIGFIPSKADPNLWMRKQEDHYEYIAVFVDDLLVISRDPEKVMEEIKYQKKNVEPPRYYNGADMCINPEFGYWQISAKTYVTNTCEKIEKLFEIKLKNYGSPMETGDHPEIDESDLLDPEEITKYQMLVGCAQWAVSLGRYNIQFATNLMARFAQSPRTGHMKRMFRLFGYLKAHAKYRIVFDPNQPNYEGLEFNDYDWSYNYQDAKEDIPDIPEPFTPNLGITVYADSNHGNFWLQGEVQRYSIDLRKNSHLYIFQEAKHY